MIFSGARVAATYAAVGAVFGLVTRSSELGFVMLQSQPSLDTAVIFASVAILSPLALALYGAVTLAERLLVPWRWRPCVECCQRCWPSWRCRPAGERRDCPGRHTDARLDAEPGPVGFYYAARGLFRNAGLDVAIRAPSDPATPLKLVAANNDRRLVRAGGVLQRRRSCRSSLLRR